MADLDKLYTSVFAAIGNLTPTDLEGESWSAAEMTKRIVKYLQKGLDTKPADVKDWKVCAKNILQSCLLTYVSVCNSKQWFYKIDLNDALADVISAKLREYGLRDFSHGELFDLIAKDMTKMLDINGLEKAVWETASNTNSMDAKDQHKLYLALMKSYWIIFDDVIKTFILKAKGDGILDKLSQVMQLEMFVQKWMDISLSDFWNRAAKPQALTKEVIIDLFTRLLTPYEADDYSCFPQALYDVAGKPPDSWGFIEDAATALLDKWQRQSKAGKKRALPED